MATYSPNLRLIEPTQNEYYGVEHFNHNNELIDKKIGEIDNKLTVVQQGATETTKGIVQFGTDAGKALPGSMLAAIQGANSYGGLISTPGQKYEGMSYWDPANKEMFICKNNNTDTSATGTNFMPFSNKTLLNRLENLIKVTEITLKKDIDRDLFSRYIGSIPESINASKIICIRLEEGSGAPAGYAIGGRTITAFYFNYQLTDVRKVRIISF